MSPHTHDVQVTSCDMPLSDADPWSDNWDNAEISPAISTRDMCPDLIGVNTKYWIIMYHQNILVLTGDMSVLSGCQSKIHKMRKQQTRHIQPPARTENNTNNLITSLDNLIIKLLVNLFVFRIYVLILSLLPPGFGVIFTMTLPSAGAPAKVN